MTPTQHLDAARRFRDLAHVADIGSHIAAERGDAITAHDQIDEADFWSACATHHEAMAAAARRNTPGDDAITS